MPKLLRLILVLLGCSPCFGGVIDVTTLPSVSIQKGQRLSVNFGVWNYAANNPGFSPVPTGFSFQAIGGLPDVFEAALIPSSTVSYLPGYLFDIWVESADGSVSFPLLDANAGALGFPAGSTVATLGTVSAGGAEHAALVLNSSVSLTELQAELLFGPALSSYDKAATVWLYNHGETFDLTLGGSYSTQNAATIIGVHGSGPAQTGAVPGTVTLYNPEPSTILLSGCAMILLCGWIRRRRA